MSKLNDICPVLDWCYHRGFGKGTIRGASVEAFQYRGTVYCQWDRSCEVNNRRAEQIFMILNPEAQTHVKAIEVVSVERRKMLIAEGKKIGEYQSARDIIDELEQQEGLLLETA